MVTGDINSFRLLIFVLIKMANYAKKNKDDILTKLTLTET